jgi:hypothetical protein
MEQVERSISPLPDPEPTYLDIINSILDDESSDRELMRQLYIDRMNLDRLRVPIPTRILREGCAEPFKHVHRETVRQWAKNEPGLKFFVFVCGLDKRPYAKHHLAEQVMYSETTKDIKRVLEMSGDFENTKVSPPIPENDDFTPRYFLVSGVSPHDWNQAMHKLYRCPGLVSFVTLSYSIPTSVAIMRIRNFKPHTTPGDVTRIVKYHLRLGQHREQVCAILRSNNQSYTDSDLFTRWIQSMKVYEQDFEAPTGKVFTITINSPSSKSCDIRRLRRIVRAIQYRDTSVLNNCGKGQVTHFLFCTMCGACDHTRNLCRLPGLPTWNGCPPIDN